MTANKQPLPIGPILVAGLARAGHAALGRLVGLLPPGTLHAWDANDSQAMQARATRWRRRGVSVCLGGDGRSLLGAGVPFGAIVKSPGIALDAPLFQAALSQGVPVIDELEVGWRLCSGPITAVTGTNGKSTTCALIAAITRAAGHPVQRVGNTEFGPPLSAAQPGPAVVCEVSSFQLEAAPSFLPAVAVFTNLSMDHLDRHGGMEAYGRVKQRMFVADGRTCGCAVVNADDPWGRRILQAVQQAGGRSLSYGFSPSADLRLVDVRWTLREAHARLAYDGRVIDLPSRLPGRHNALNIAAAVGAAVASGVGWDAIAAGVAGAEAPPGRCRLIDDGHPFDVVVDYAHTPDGIAQFLDAMRVVVDARGGALRTVFGAVGLPDPVKARGCAQAARRWSDHVIFTTGSAPRSSRVLRLRELRDAGREIGPVELVLDRRRAIQRALVSARPGDVVAILGLGALRYQTLNDKGAYAAFNDADAAASLLRESPL